MQFFKCSAFKSFALLLVALMALVACGETQRPFQPDEKYLPIVRPVSPQAAELLREHNSVVIQSIVNAPGNGGERLAASMAVALRNEGVAANVVAEEGGLTLAGIADIRTFPNDIEVHIVWYVLDAKGKRIGQQDQLTRGRLEDWQAGDDRLLSRIALAGAPNLARLLQALAANPQPMVAQNPAQNPGQNPAAPTKPGATPAVTPASTPASTPAGKAPPPAAPATTALGFHVAKVSGAPGDGNDSLTAGMRLALGRRGFVLFAKPDTKSYIIAGKVSLSPVDQERDKITITWTVSDPDNKKMGDIEQSNVIPKGSLSGEWGGIAKEITVAGAEGLLDLLGRIAKGAK